MSILILPPTGRCVTPIRAALVARSWTEQPPEQHTLLATLGPEPLSRAFNGDYLFQRSRRRQIAVKSFLMDHKIVVGIGNIYANEALFQARIAPLCPAGKIHAEDYARLAQCSKQALKQAIKAGGTTLNDFYSVAGQPGYFSQQLWVYGREGQPCLRCKETLTKIIIGQRSAVYCKNCQGEGKHPDNGQNRLWMK